MAGNIKLSEMCRHIIAYLLITETSVGEKEEGRKIQAPFHLQSKLHILTLNCLCNVTAASLEQDLLDMYEQIHGLPGRNNFWLEQQEKWRLFITRRITRLTITEYTEKISLVHVAATCRVIFVCYFI